MAIYVVCTQQFLLHLRMKSINKQINFLNEYVVVVCVGDQRHAMARLAITLASYWFSFVWVSN